MSSSDEKKQATYLDFDDETEQSLTDDDSNSEDSPFEVDSEKKWAQNEFPLRKPRKTRGINVVLALYGRLRKKLKGSKDEPSEEYQPLCCDGLKGIVMLFILLVLDVAYVGYSCSVNHLANEDNIRLLWLSVLVWIIILSKILHRFIRLGHTKGGRYTCFATCGDAIQRGLKSLGGILRRPWDRFWENNSPDTRTRRKRKHFAKIIISGVIMGAFCLFTFVYFVIMVNVSNLISLAGIVVLLFICVLISWHPGKIIWQPVLVGLFIQLFFAVLTLQTKPGYEVFSWLGDRMSEFLENSQAGSTFVFADLSCFAFNVLPVVIFFSAFVAVCFHLGIITLAIDKPSKVASKLLKTTGPETLNAVANIFVSMTESPLITRPYMHLMTNSELHTIIVNGFASVAGSVLAAYISFGVPANHLLIACVMSAPAALAISKIIYPETKNAPLKYVNMAVSITSPYNNVLEAAMVGAMDAIPIVGGIASNLIAFLSIYNFFNRTLTWLGAQALSPVDITFELVFSYLLWPIAYVIGIPQIDCFRVAELIGVKSMLNEFVAFERLGVLIKDKPIFEARDQNIPINYLRNGSWLITMPNGSTVTLLYGALYTRRAEVITTYALCGFANVGSIGIMLGALVTLLPHRRKDLSEMVLGGMIGGTIACFLTGCFAGLFFDERI